VENLGELQPLAVKAGLNGVMMGNFLTTLGAEPEDDRGMFEELGLNVARQADNGANPRPDNRSGWLEGSTPATPIDDLIDRQAEADFWDPSTQLRVIKTTKKPPPYPREVQPASNPAAPGREAEEAAGGNSVAGWGD
jgi:biotin synthase